jgi:hypothetical protein
MKPQERRKPQEDANGISQCSPFRGVFDMEEFFNEIS